MYYTVTVQITGTTVPPVALPCRLKMSLGPGDQQSLAGGIGLGLKIDQVSVNCRAMGVVAVDAGGIIIDNVLAMGERNITVQITGIVTFKAKAARPKIEI